MPINAAGNRWQRAAQEQKHLAQANGHIAELRVQIARPVSVLCAFDLGFLPGMSREQANRFNVLDQHYFFDSAVALLGPQRKEFLRHYKFDVAPTTDDRPYFFDFFKWQALPELLERRTLGGAALLDWGYAVLVATLVQARSSG